MTPSRTFVTRIVDGTRSVHPRGRYPVTTVCLLTLFPLIPALPAVLDSRPGFQLVMVSVTVYAIALAVAIFMWVGALRERVVRVSSAGPLRFVAPRGAHLAFWLVGTVGLLPAAATIFVRAESLPTIDGGRLLEWGPYALALVSVAGLVRQASTLRTPLGLTLDETGLQGVRGSSRVQIRWSDLASVDVVGPRGAKLTLSGPDRMPILVDAHHVGSDPAAVAGFIAFFRDAPDQRAALADGIAAVQLVERAQRR